MTGNNYLQDLLDNNYNFYDFVDAAHNDAEESDIQAIIDYGVDGGLFVNYHENKAIFLRYEDEIFERIAEQAAELGYNSAMDYLSKLEGAYAIGDSIYSFYCVCVWVATESVCFQINEGF